MKKKLLFLSFAFSSLFMFSQVSAGQTDDFEDETRQGWAVGNAAISQITNQAGGQTGATDNFLQYIANSNGGGPGGKMIIFNRDQWTGNYTSESIVELRFDAKVEGTTDLELRFSLSNQTGAGDGSGIRMSTTNAISITAGSGWNSYTMPINASDFTIFEGGGNGTTADVLANVAEARILHALSPNWFGTGVVSGTLQLDNISASTTLSKQDFNIENNFNIYPNPSTTNLNLNFKNVDSNTLVEVYNILGAKVYSRTINNNKSTINTTQWQKGVYLVRVSSDIRTITKRFVKQ